MNPASRHRRHIRSRSRLNGTAKRPRVSIYRSTRRIIVQLINDATGTTMAAIHEGSQQQTKTSQASQAGKELAALALAKGIKNVVFDRSGYKYHGRVKAVAEGLRSGGLKF